MTCCCRMLYPSYLPYYDSSCEYVCISFGASGLQPLRQTSPCLFLVAFCGGWAGVWQRRRESRGCWRPNSGLHLLLCFAYCALLCFMMRWKTRPRFLLRKPHRQNGETYLTMTASLRLTGLRRHKSRSAIAKKQPCRCCCIPPPESNGECRRKHE